MVAVPALIVLHHRSKVEPRGTRSRCQEPVSLLTSPHLASQPEWPRHGISGGLRVAKPSYCQGLTHAPQEQAGLLPQHDREASDVGVGSSSSFTKPFLFYHFRVCRVIWSGT